MTPRRRALVAALALLAPAAQGCYTRAELEHPPPAPLGFRIVPYPTYDGDDGLGLHVNAGWNSSSGRRPPPIGMRIGMDAYLTTSGSRGAVAMLDAPGRWYKWRVLGVLGAERLQNVPFFGVGNTAPAVDTFPDDYYRYALTRYTVAATVQRRLGGHLRLHLGSQFRHYHPRSLGDSTLLGQQITAGIISDTISGSGLELRAGLLFDSRDQEASPTRGVFFEVMGAQAVSGFDYRRYLLSAREFFPIGDLEQWVLALRQTLEISEGTLPVFVAYERVTTWHPEDGFGGPTSLRIYSTGRFVAPNRSVVSADLRYKLLDAPFPTAPLRIWLLGFVDVGRLWDQGEQPDLTGLHWSTGVGGRLQITKSTIFGIDIGRNDEAFGFGIGTSFAF